MPRNTNTDLDGAIHTRELKRLLAYLADNRTEGGSDADDTRAGERAARWLMKQHAAQREFLALIARMQTEDETEGGMVSEDAISTVNELIASARQLTGIDPKHPRVYCVICGEGKCECDA